MTLNSVAPLTLKNPRGRAVSISLRRILLDTSLAPVLRITGRIALVVAGVAGLMSRLCAARYRQALTLFRDFAVGCAL
jgi:hypothetical protein